ncbi:TPA: hypothetical protein ACIJ26_006770 [Pseudomonas aeruginosa]
MSKELNKAPVEQAGGDERAAFNAWLNEVTYEENTDRGVFKVQRHQTLSVEDERIAWRAWQARAALAQPSPVRSSLLINGYQLRAALDFIAPDGTAEQLESEACIEWRQQDADFLEAGLYAFCAEYPEKGGVLLDEEPTNSQPSPAQAEQAEAERPEVVARVMHSNPVALDQCAPLNANDELMTVAQHAASVARWAEMFNRVEQERDSALAEVERLTRDRDDCLKARLHYATQLGEALARVAELENQDPVAHLRASDLERLNQPGIAGSAGSLWNGPREGFVPLYAAPVAQAQHSVPDELRAICMLVAETGIKYGGGRHRAVAADECRAVVNAVLNADLSVGRACEYAGCCEKAHPGTSLCIAHHSKKAREQLLAAAPQQGGRS